MSRLLLQSARVLLAVLSVSSLLVTASALSTVVAGSVVSSWSDSSLYIAQASGLAVDPQQYGSFWVADVLNNNVIRLAQHSSALALSFTPHRAGC
jgi:hypothetical protein